MKHFPKLLMLALLAATFAAPSLAQPDPDNAPKADNPQNRPVRPNNPNRGDRQQLTPEQLQEMRDKFMTRQLERAGVTDKDQQKIVVDYIQDEVEARSKLEESGRALSQALRTETATDTQIAGLLNTHNAAVEDDKIRRTAAQKQLSEKLDLLKAPRLEAFLTLAGLYGQGSGFGGNAAMAGMLGRGGNNNRRNQKN